MQGTYNTEIVNNRGNFSGKESKSRERDSGWENGGFEDRLRGMGEGERRWDWRAEEIVERQDMRRS